MIELRITFLPSKAPLDTINKIAEQLDLCQKRAELIEYTLEAGAYKEVEEGTKITLKTSSKGEANGNSKDPAPS